MGHQVKITWISMEELKPPKDWTLPFIAKYQGKHYLITGVDYVDQLWRAEDMSVDVHSPNTNKI